jgi:hypothetical protein
VGRPPARHHNDSICNMEGLVSWWHYLSHTLSVSETQLPSSRSRGDPPAQVGAPSCRPLVPPRRTLTTTLKKHAKRQTPNAKRQTPNAKRRPHAQRTETEPPRHRQANPPWLANQ